MDECLLEALGDNDLNIPMVKKAMGIYHNQFSEGDGWVKQPATPTSEGKVGTVEGKPAPNWYDEMSLTNYFGNVFKHRGFSYDEIKIIASVIAKLYADDLQRAFAKGWEKAYNDVNKSGTFDYVYYPKTEHDVTQHSQSLDIRRVLEYVIMVTKNHSNGKLIIDSDIILAMQPEIEKMLKEK